MIRTLSTLALLFVFGACDAGHASSTEIPATTDGKADCAMCPTMKAKTDCAESDCTPEQKADCAACPETEAANATKEEECVECPSAQTPKVGE